ncbi:ATPase, T2SS/T4P/T4SS family [uncultured Zoogloea sp.]|uniref:ATPase, T2SS/T4P/T4SS family n=1 Tax=uncultured Zoogloea sp. TaxID=160237 RepID=UPI00260C9BA8|nr:ATPase, T2SS/T4P/T4SS family [uncultured Zoogloea sp.]
MGSDKPDLYTGALLPKVEVKTGYKDPFRFNHADQFKALMLESLAHNASDIFIQPELPICAQINGRMTALTHRPVDDGEVKTILKWAADRDTALTDILEGKAVNARYELFDPEKRAASGAKLRYGYRVNAVPVLCAGASSAQIVIRSIPTEPPTAQQIGLSEEILVGATPKTGIVYVAGATGSGKTTSFAAIIRHVLEGDTPIKGNIVTYEEPIEFRFNMIQSRHSVIVQTQVPNMIPDFYNGIREAMRRKPELIMIGELRDEETIRSAVEASLTGHAVFATVHAINVAAVMRRLISRFPEGERATAIFDIVETSRFIMAQRLVRTRTGGRVAAREYLVFDEDVREQLIGLDQMGKVTQEVKRLVEERGHSFKKEAARLLEAGVIDEQVARELSHS